MAKACCDSDSIRRTGRVVACLFRFTSGPLRPQSTAQACPTLRDGGPALSRPADHPRRAMTLTQSVGTVQ